MRKYHDSEETASGAQYITFSLYLSFSFFFMTSFTLDNPEAQALELFGLVRYLTLHTYFHLEQTLILLPGVCYLFQRNCFLTLACLTDFVGIDCL